MSVKLFQKIVREIIIRYSPIDIGCKRILLFNKYLKQVRFRGKRIILKKDVRFIRSKGLALGNNIEIKGGGIIDATAGILLGDNCIIDKNIKITTVDRNVVPRQYAPIIIGAGNRVSRDIKSGTILPNQTPCKGLSNYEGQIVFILSTGRSGSKSIAELLNGHPDAECYHDSFPHVYTWCCDLLYGRRSRREIKEKILALYNATAIGKGLVHGQSDQKLAALVPILAEVFPNAKFIWLIRRADSFLNSSYPRGWYDNSEFGYPPNMNEFFSKNATPSEFDAAHRINGFLVGEIEENTWKKMSAFERNCWYWSYWNNLIEKELSLLPGSRSIQLKLHELSSKTKEVQYFLGLPNIEIKTEKVNAARYKKLTRKDWTHEMENIYLQHCEVDMKRWFR